MKEVWKDCKGYEKTHEISNTGKIRSKSRFLSKTDYRQGKILKPISVGKNNKKYFLYANGTKHKEYAYKLVALTFFKDYNPNKDIVIKIKNIPDDSISNIKIIKDGIKLLEN